jgi:hypothetical protein
MSLHLGRVTRRNPFCSHAPQPEQMPVDASEVVMFFVNSSQMAVGFAHN